MSGGAGGGSGSTAGRDVRGRIVDGNSVQLRAGCREDFARSRGGSAPPGEDADEDEEFDQVICLLRSLPGHLKNVPTRYPHLRQTLLRIK